MNIKIKTFSVLTLLLLIGVCKFTIHSELKFSSVLELLKPSYKGKSLIETKIQIEMSSLEKCNEEKDSLALILKEYLQGLKDVECQNSEIETLWVGKFQLPMVKMINGQYEVTNGLFNITVANIKSIKIGMYRNEEEFSELKKKLDEKYSDTVKLEGLQFGIDFANDSETELNLKLDSVYTSGKAYPKRASIKLEAEQMFTFTLSQILLASINERSHSDFMTIEAVEKPDK